MKAVVVRAFGGPEVLRVEDLLEPVPGPGQLSVAIRAIGVNPVEVYIRAGTYPRKPELPYVPGTDAAGVVEKAGAGAPFKPGDRVYIYGPVSGAYAEKAVVDASRAFALPPALSYAQGAALGVPYATAHRALFHCAAARAGETVLVHGASGGVGVAAVQLALAAGLTVIGTAGGPDGVDFVRSLGAALVFDHREAGYQERVAKAGAPDVIVEMLANVNLPADLLLAAPRGRIVVVGSRGPVQIDPRAAMAKDLAIRGMSLWNMTDAERETVHRALGEGLRAGDLRPVIAQTFCLADAAKAHEAVMASGARGKIVLCL